MCVARVMVAGKRAISEQCGDHFRAADVDGWWHERQLLLLECSYMGCVAVLKIQNP
jgi:hypothetical protein